MRFSLLNKGSKVLVLSILVLTLSVLSFGGVASAQALHGHKHHHKKHHKKVEVLEAFTTTCKLEVVPTEIKETAPGMGSGTVTLSDCRPNVVFTLTAVVPQGCVVTFGPNNTPTTDLEGRANRAFFFTGVACVPGNYLMLATSPAAAGGIVLAAPFSISPP